MHIFIPLHFLSERQCLLCLLDAEKPSAVSQEDFLSFIYLTATGKIPANHKNVQINNSDIQNGLRFPFMSYLLSG